MWPLISPFLDKNPWDSLKSVIEKSNTYTFPRVKRHYCILTNPQTDKPNNKHNPQITNPVPNLTPIYKKKPNPSNHQPRNTQTQK